MLWYKAWRESRTRFVLIALFMVWYCCFAVFTQKRARASSGIRGTEGAIGYTAYLYFSVYGKAAFGFLLFCPALLGMGGLLQEGSRGTASTSLSLPVTRSQMTGIRAAVGLIQMGVLALIPAVLLTGLSPIVGESYQFSVALHFAVLWTVCCSAFFGMAFFFSALLSGGYTALVASFTAAFSYEFVMAYLHNPFQLAAIMGGMNAPLAGVLPSGLPDPFPWFKLAAIVVVAVFLLTAATRLTERRDF